MEDKARAKFEQGLALSSDVHMQSCGLAWPPQAQPYLQISVTQRSNLPQEAFQPHWKFKACVQLAWPIVGSTAKRQPL
eukprot:4863965-Amphidinium_carterae.1